MITATYIGGVLDGTVEQREPQDTPPQLHTYLRTPLGTCEAIYLRLDEPDHEGRVVYALVAEGVPFTCKK